MAISHVESTDEAALSAPNGRGSPAGTELDVRSVVDFHRVAKRYSHGAGRRFLRDHLAGFFREQDPDDFYALKDVSFHLNSGESLAVIGSNGAGKSTLLNLVAGVSCADEGTVSVHGSMAALLELGSGFHPDLTGKENVYLNASLLGLSRKQARERFDGIVEFSGIGDFIKEPLRTYSSGMVLRLAFSVAVNVEPDILLIDEVLAVGDQQFQGKCLRKIFDFKQAGRTLICVSHALPLLLDLCDKAIWLEHGQAAMWGEAQIVIKAYQASMARGPAA